MHGSTMRTVLPIIHPAVERRSFFHCLRSRRMGAFCRAEPLVLRGGAVWNASVLGATRMSPSLR